MFEKIMDMIHAVMPVIQIGSTGYLDEVPWIFAPMKGEDKFGRRFIALPIHSHNEYKVCEDGQLWTNDGYGVVVLFQRYSKDPDIWVQAESHKAGRGRATLGVVSSVTFEAEQVLEKAITELLTKGESEYDYPGMVYSKLKIRLLNETEIEHYKKIQNSRDSEE